MPVRFTLIFIILCLSFFPVYLYPQTASWIMQQLPGNFPTNFNYAVGETGMIFVDDTSNIVYAFDINQGQWVTYNAQSNDTWTGALADGNVALVWSDSLVVAYSALTHSFSPLPNVGYLINGGAVHGCKENFAYVVGPGNWYVFDAEDAQWHPYGYTPPGNPGAVIQGGVHGDKDYLYLHLSVLNEAPATLAAYSLITKSFDERNLEYISNPIRLDHGFTFHYNHSGGPFYGGGYSAYTGSFSMKNSTVLISPQGPGYFPEIVATKITYAFTMHEHLSPEFYRRWLWVYNTMTGQFYEYWYIVDYAGTNAVPHGMRVGGQFAVDWVRNVGYQNQMECILFSAETNTFTNFFSPLYYRQFFNPNFSPGGNIFDGYDSVRYYIHDVKTGADHSTAVVWESGFQPGVKARSLNDYWMVFAYRDQFEDTLHVFSYSRETGNFSEFMIPNSGASGWDHGRDFFWIRVVDSFEPDKVLLYSPKHDQWSEKDLSTTSYWAGNGNYFYLNYSGLNQTLLYDGFTNQEFTFPSAQISQHVFSRDSVFLMYTNTGKYIGYSLVEHDTSEYTTPRLQGQQWSNYIVLALNVSGSRYEHLLYDGYNNNFAPLILTAQHGIRRYAWPGGKTALVMTDNGYLFAYYPGATTHIDINPYDKDAIIATPRLHQNYPNPFNPTTLIKFDLPITQNVTLKIYNVLGQLVDTLIDNPLTAGPHEYQWEAVTRASGLYFYVLEAGDHKLIKKMILMK